MFSDARPAGNVVLVDADEPNSAIVKYFDLEDSLYAKEYLRGRLETSDVHPGDDMTNSVVNNLPLLGILKMYPPVGGEFAVKLI